MSDTHTISLNGHNYDALTGKMIKKSDSGKLDSSSSSNKLQAFRQSSQNKVIDGFFSSTVGKNQLTQKKTKNNFSKTKQSANHSVAPHISRVSEHSKTLMRTAVKNPGIAKLKEQPKIAKKRVNYAVSRGLEASAPIRANMLERASAIKKSEFVGKFSELASPANPITPDPETIQTTANSEVHLKNLDQLSQIEANPASDDIFTEAALRLSDTQTPTKLKKISLFKKTANKLHMSVKTFSLILICLFILVAGLITAYIFSSNISIYLADSKTGIHGTLPTYMPPGFSVSSISYQKSEPSAVIFINYKSNSDGRYYRIQEQATTWDNQGLLTSVVQPYTGTNYTTTENSGRNVYNYGSTSVWVGSGVYYNLTNNANLTTNQIGQIVSST